MIGVDLRAGDGRQREPRDNGEKSAHHGVTSVVVVTDRNSVGKVIGSVGSVIVGSRLEVVLVVLIDVLELLELLDDVDDDVDDEDEDDVVGAELLVVDVLLVVGGAVVLVEVLGVTVIEVVVLLLVLVAVVDEAVLEEVLLVDVVVGPPSSRAGAHRTCSERTVNVSEPNWSWTSMVWCGFEPPCVL